LWGVTLGGVYATKYSDNKAAKPSDETLAREYNTAYISLQTALAYNAESDLVFTAAGGKIQSPAITVCREPYTGFVEYGSAGALAADEIALSVGLAGTYASDPESLIGQTVQITFANARNIATKEPYGEITLTRKVKYIMRGVGAAVLSDADCSAVLPVCGNRLFGDKIWGVRMAECSKSAAQSLVAHGFTCNSRFAEQIAAGVDWQRTLSYIELAAGAALLLVSVFMLCNHVSALVDKEKRALGVLASFGVRMRRAALMFLAGTFVAVFICLALASLTEFAVVAGINGIMAKAGITVIKTFFYEPLAVVCLMAIFAIVLFTLYVRVVHKLSKKQIVDVIYER
ncbi:MAG: hypothetical protein K2L51_00405, partial [Clostridiales bacterium]|nr:hypothetical protein [Clostridiales bacterium]